MFINDKKELRKIETSIFNRAKTQVTADAEHYVDAFLELSVAMFLRKLFIDRNDCGEPVDIEEDCEKMMEKLGDKALAEFTVVGLYSATPNGIRITLANGIKIYIERSNKKLYHGDITDRNYFYFNRKEIDNFCDAIIYVADNLERWRTKAEAVKLKVLKERMQAKMNRTAVNSLIDTKMKEAGFEYIRKGNSKQETIKIKITNEQTGVFYLKMDNLVENLEKIISIAKMLRDYVNEGNKIQVRFKSIYDGLHQYEYEHRFDKWRH